MVSSFNRHVAASTAWVIVLRTQASSHDKTFISAISCDEMSDYLYYNCHVLRCGLWLKCACHGHKKPNSVSCCICFCDNLKGTDPLRRPSIFLLDVLTLLYHLPRDLNARYVAVPVLGLVLSEILIAAAEGYEVCCCFFYSPSWSLMPSAAAFVFVKNWGASYFYISLNCYTIFQEPWTRHCHSY